MALKRSNSEGTIFKKDNGRWRAQVTLGGKRLSKTFATQREAREWLRGTQNQIDGGLTLIGARMTMQEYMDAWLTGVKNTRREHTYTTYESINRLHLMPYLGKVRLKDLRPDQIQRLYGILAENGVGVHTIRKLRMVLHAALEQAVMLGTIPRNPVNLTETPEEPHTEIEVMSESQASQFLAACQGHRWEALFYLAITTGMRQKEILGLKWGDLDWVAKTIQVERQMDSAGNNVRFAPLKTRQSRRKITLGDEVIAVLRRHYDRQLVMRREAGDGWHEHDLIFALETGRPISTRYLWGEFKALLKLAGLPDFRFHDLRHTAASLMLIHNIPPIVVSRRLGHAKTSITQDIYGHMIPGAEEKAAALMDELVIPVKLHLVAPAEPEDGRTP